MAITPYNPYYPYPQNYYPATQTMYQQQPQQSQGNSITWVKDTSEAELYPVAPNSAVVLWDSSAPIIYLKQADASGKPTIKAYDLVERSNSPRKDEKTLSADYVSRSELKQFDEAIKAIRSDIEKISGDLYGLAGKKKSQKKVEDDE